MAPVLPRIVLVDANVFFAPRMRDLFMHLHVSRLLSIHWTRTIESEWSRNVVSKHGSCAADIQDCLRGMRGAAEGWEVAGHEKHIPRFEGVDPKDRHVAAAAYKLSLDDWPGQPVALITQNLKDFPPAAMAGTLVTCHAMGAYLDTLHGEAPDEVARVAEGCRRKLRAPKLTREQYVAVLMKHGCVAMARGLADRWSVDCPSVAKDGTLVYAPAPAPSTRKSSRT